MLEVGDPAPEFTVRDNTGRKVRLAYGAAGTPESQYAKRISYVIGEDGNILLRYPKVDPKEHVDQVLRDLDALG